VSRRPAIPLAVAATLLVATQARAQDVTQTESPQHFAAEIKLGPYQPEVDREAGLAGSPYQDVFGSKSTFHFLAEFDWQFARVPGVSFGLGVMAGFFGETAKALDPETGERSGDRTALWVLPGHLDAVIRVDVLPDYTRVPLVPYFKIGVSYYIWWILDGDGLARHEGEAGYGGTWGWNFSAGLMLQLDFFEPSAASNFDHEVGVNHSYLYADFFYADVDNFGRGNKLRLSDKTWTVGLAIEF